MRGNKGRKIRELYCGKSANFLKSGTTQVFAAELCGSTSTRSANMEFPPTWRFIDAEEFESATPTLGDLCAALYLQARPNGRMLDHFRIGVGGNNILDVDVSCNKLFPSPNLNNWHLKKQYWPRDINIRRNATTSKWEDIRDMLAARDATIEDGDGTEVEVEDALHVLDTLPETMQKSASTRWAIVVDDDNNLRLDLQGLPASKDYIDGKPLLKG